jgi:hypothetical protein
VGASGDLPIAELRPSIDTPLVDRPSAALIRWVDLPIDPPVESHRDSVIGAAEHRVWASECSLTPFSSIAASVKQPGRLCSH